MLPSAVLFVFLVGNRRSAIHNRMNKFFARYERPVMNESIFNGVFARARNIGITQAFRLHGEA